MEWVAIADHADEHGVLRGRRYSDCTIVGPATLVLQDGNRLSDCDFMRPAGADTAMRAATVYVIDCTFERCRFDSGISFRVPAGGDGI